MRGKMLRVTAPPDAIDIVGTGGDGPGTYNVSTLAALIVAACGVPVAKHGNRAASSKSGASDVLGALGVASACRRKRVETCLERRGIGFMMAPTHHAAMRHVGAGAQRTRHPHDLQSARAALPIRPASSASCSASFPPPGSSRWREVLRNLGSERVWLVHGADGLDEMTTTGPTHVTALEDGVIRTFEITPEDAGLPRAPRSPISRAAMRRIMPPLCARFSNGAKTPIATLPSSMPPRLWSSPKKPLI